MLYLNVLLTCIFHSTAVHIFLSFYLSVCINMQFIFQILSLAFNIKFVDSFHSKFYRHFLLLSLSTHFRLEFVWFSTWTLVLLFLSSYITQKRDWTWEIWSLQFFFWQANESLVKVVHPWGWSWCTSMRSHMVKMQTLTSMPRIERVPSSLRLKTLVITLWWIRSWSDARLNVSVPFYFIPFFASPLKKIVQGRLFLLARLVVVLLYMYDQILKILCLAASPMRAQLFTWGLFWGSDPGSRLLFCQIPVSRLHYVRKQFSFFGHFPGPAWPHFPFSRQNNLTFTCHAYKISAIPRHAWTPMRPTLREEFKQGLSWVRTKNLIV